MRHELPSRAEPMNTLSNESTEVTSHPSIRA